MRGAIMQPYFFPYIGYYQLAYEAEKFVFLDDVSFIKQGYINRNSVLLGMKSHRFSLPVRDASSYRAINEHVYVSDYRKFLKLLEQAYSRAPYYRDAMPVVEQVLLSGDECVSRKNAASITSVFDYLGLSRSFAFSSDDAFASGLKGQDRVLALCREYGIDQYRNSIGGRALYSHEAFAGWGVELKFIRSGSVRYRQHADDFVANLSIIDALMYIDRASIKDALSNYELID
ncbi:MAG: hypothetical protein ABS98_04695 [Lysobacteraceae bacterium SCN 69-48]|nr:MAG: hypothetical protein ABS98_04695 [Xanthomonadaceae bacterium SCN 69-48]